VTLPDLRIGKTREVWRCAYLLCLPLVFAYIFFEVLDLDGSNLPSVTSETDRSPVVAELSPEASIESFSESMQSPIDCAVVSTDQSYDHKRFQRINLRTLTPLENARAHRYRVSLPRDAVPG
jgi:hypothetical protein